MTTYAYEAVYPEPASRIMLASAQVQRQIAVALAALAVEGTPTTRGSAGLAALQAGDFGDSALRRALLVDAGVADETYERLREERERAEDAGETYPAELSIELTAANRTARLYQLLAGALDADARVAALEAAGSALHVLSGMEVLDVVEDILDAADVEHPAGFTHGWKD